jgi:hypothetical protein
LSYVGRALRAGDAVNATHATGADSRKQGRRELVVLLGVNPVFGEAVTAHHLRELSLPLIDDAEKGLFGDGASSLHSVQMGLLPSSLPPAVREGREGAYDAHAVLQLPLRDAALSYLRTYPVPPDGRFEREPPELV